MKKKSVIFLVCLGIMIGFFYRELYVVVCCRSEPVALQVAAGEAFKSLTKSLEELNLIRSSFFFRTYAKLTGLDTEIKAGRFRIAPDLAPASILQFLVKPQNGEISVTIPEGYSVFDIDKKLVSLGLIREGEFVDYTKSIDSQGGPSATYLIDARAQITQAEGFLFPDTYFVFSKNFHPADLASAMTDTFGKKVLRDLASDIKRNKRLLLEIITTASILEKEVRAKEDFAIVAGILWKRLDHGWPLQADATLLYGKSGRKLSREELREDSAYNTYTRRGLPPTPIGNPGLETIKAALNPVDSPYWFYLTAENGKVIYSRTNEEHNENKRKYLM